MFLNLGRGRLYTHIRLSISRRANYVNQGRVHLVCDQFEEIEQSAEGLHQQITVDELHEYAREKVQEATPTMQPEIYAVREGYKILLARAPQGDPKLVFRKEFDAHARLKRDKLLPIDQ